MVKKFKSLSENQLAQTVKDSAQQIWLAGLGAYAKAQEEGTKVFDTLVKEGLSIQRKTQSVAEERISAATQKVSNMASDIGSRAAGQWDKLESIFEERVANAMGKLGVPSAKDIAALNARIDALSAQLGKPAAPAATKAPAKKASAAKPAAKRPAAPKASKAPAKSE